MRNIGDCVIFTDGGFPVNIAFPIALGTLGTATIFGQTALGPARISDGSTSSVCTIPHHVPYNNGNWTIRVRFTPISYPSGFCQLFNKGTNTAREMACYLDTSGNVSFLGWNAGNSGASQALSTGCTAGRNWDFTVVNSGGAGGFPVFYVNAISKGNSLTATTAGGTNTWYFGVDSNGTSNPSHNAYNIFQAWSRALSVPEIQSLYFNPYIGLISAKRYLMSQAAAGPPPGAVNFRRTLSAFGTRAGSRQEQQQT